MKAAGFSETLVAFGQFIRRNIQKPEELILTALISLNLTEFYSKDLKEIGGSNMTGPDCGLFTHKSVPVIFEPPCTTWET
jgi:hypothetical protein